MTVELRIHWNIDLLLDLSDSEKRLLIQLLDRGGKKPQLVQGLDYLEERLSESFPVEVKYIVKSFFYSLN